MSLKTSRRRTPSMRRPQVPVARGALRFEPTEQQRLVLEGVRDLPQQGDVLLAELIVGSALTEAALLESSTPCLSELPAGVTVRIEVPDDADRPGLTDPDALRFDAGTEHDLWRGVISAAAALPSRRSLALLRAMAAIVGEPRVAADAAAGADMLAATGRLPEPRWADVLSTLECDDCWVSEEVGYTIVLASYRYGERRHGLSILVDRLMGGVAKNAGIVGIDEVLQRFPDLAPVPAGYAHRLIAEGYELTYAYRDLPVDPDVHRLRLAAHRRVRAFGHL